MIKKITLSLVALVATSLITTTQAKTNEDGTKSGWNFGPCPAVSYSSDFGFQYGVLCDIFYYGDGSTYPEYKHKFYVEASKYTKGASILNFSYDSKYLIKGLRTTFNVAYLPDEMLDFYGFNGYMSPYDATQGNSFYKIDREYFRASLDFQGKISDNINWAAGVGYYDYTLTPVQLEKYADSANLLSLYAQEGIIESDHITGKHLEFRVGLVHDTRDHEADPTRGFWTEAIATASPDIFEGGDQSFGRFTLTHRGYIPVVGEKLTFAYRALYQGGIFGETPIYQLQNISTLYAKKTFSEGLGGYTSIRGVLRNRAVGEGYALGNIELRYRFAHFNLIGQKWYFAFNPFFDFGRVVDSYKAEQIMASSNPLIYDGGEESIHTSAGAGFKLVMNQNFILNAEYGKALNSQDGSGATTIGLNFLF